MTDLLAILLDVGDYMIAIAISFIAWRRFKSSGALIAVAGFILLTIAPVVGRSAFAWTRVSTSADRFDNLWYLITLAAALAFLGTLLLVFSVKRLISRIESKDH